MLLIVIWLAQFEFLIVEMERRRAIMFAGLLCMAIGGILRVSAIFELRSRFRSDLFAADVTGLVESGVYRLLRHPSESGTLALALGISAVFRSWWAFGFSLAVLLPLVLYRIGLEDRLLHTVFGVRFLNYAGRVRRLIPYVY